LQDKVDVLVLADEWVGGGEIPCKRLSESTFYPMLTSCLKNIAFGRFVVTRQFVLLVRATCTRRL